MNWKIILAGGVIAVSLVASFVLFQFYQNRQTTLNIPQGNTVTNYVPINNLGEDAQQAIKQEVTTQNQLIRGKVVSQNQETNTFSVAAETMKPTGELSVIGVLDIIVEQERINEYLCWPEYFTVNQNERIDITKAYIPIPEGSYLYMKGETKQTIDTLYNALSEGPYVFAKLQNVITTNNQVIEDTSQVQEQYVTELAILGC